LQSECGEKRQHFIKRWFFCHTKEDPQVTGEFINNKEVAGKTVNGCDNAVRLRIRFGVVVGGCLQKSKVDVDALSGFGGVGGCLAGTTFLDAGLDCMVNKAHRMCAEFGRETCGVLWYELELPFFTVAKSCGP
jgi:hypothetical protein